MRVASADSRVAELEPLLDKERQSFEGKTAASRRERVSERRRIPGGVSSDFQATEAHIAYIASARGSRITTIDGDDLVDFHMGAGAALIGHGNPLVERAVSTTLKSGSCLAAPSVDALPVAEALADRFGAPLWRFVNSGTEAIMTAVRVARAVTSRDLVVRLANTYHGHDDAALADLDAAPSEGTPSVWNRGLPQVVRHLVRITQLNERDELGTLFRREGSEIACVLVEMPTLTPTLTIPDRSFVEDLNELSDAYGALIIADEVKTGASVDWGAGSTLYGLRPDLIAAGKAIGGGLPLGAVGGTESVLGGIGTSGPRIVGTFNGNPVSMAASRVALKEVLQPSVYERLSSLNQTLLGTPHLAELSARHGIRASALGARGGLDIPPSISLIWGTERLRELIWLFLFNRGVYLGPTPDVRWILSAAHTQHDVMLMAQVLGELARVIPPLKDSGKE